MHRLLPLLLLLGSLLGVSAAAQSGSSEQAGSPGALTDEVSVHLEAFFTLDTIIDKVWRNAPNTLSAGDTYSFGLRYSLGLGYPAILSAIYSRPGGGLIEHKFDPRYDHFPSWTVENQEGTYVLETLMLYVDSGNIYYYQRNGKVEGYTGYLGMHSLDLSLLDYTIAPLPPADVVIQTQPVSLLLLEGADASLDVVATGSELNYQWSKNGVVSFGEASPKQSFFGAKASDNGTYTVRVYNRAQSVTSTPATVTVLAPAVVKVSPFGQTVHVGERVELSVSATGSSLEYQWYRNGAKLMGASERVLVIANSDISDSGTYRCDVRNALSSAKSADAVLTVRPVVTMDISIQSQPQSRTVLLGSTVSFEVEATGTEILYQWLKDGQEVFGATGAKYTIPKTAPADAGKYAVRVYNDAGAVLSEEVVLAFGSATAITLDPKSQTVDERSRVVFTVAASGSQVSYQWYKDEVKLSGATGSELVLEKVRVPDAGSYWAQVFDAKTVATSAKAVLVVRPIPVFTEQPKSAEVIEGGAVTLSVAIDGGGSMSWQWYRGEVALKNATSTTLELSPVLLADAGTYRLKVSNATGDFWSSSAVITVKELGTAPKLLNSPKAETVACGQEKVLSVKALGGALTYQWFRNGKAVAGATGPSLVLASPSSLDNGDYTCVVTNTLGTLTTDAATLTFSPSLERNAAGRVANLSSRILVGRDNAAMVAGFSIEGTQPKTVLLRASGPALAPFGVTGVLANPVLRLHDMSNKGEVIATNDDWDYDSIAATADLVGSFAWPKGSKDAALLVVLKPGLYSAEVVDRDSAEGVSLVEVYEVGGGAKCVNLSTRGLVGTDSTAQVAGFVIEGPGLKTILIRASGPALAQWMSGTVPDPVLEIRDDKGGLLFSNDNWSGAEIKRAAEATGAFAWQEGSRDAALLLSLPEGHYTAVVQDKTGTRGIGLVEIYEVNK